MRVTYDYTNYPHSKAATAWSRFRGMITSTIIIWILLLTFLINEILLKFLNSNVATPLAFVLVILGMFFFLKFSKRREMLCASYDLEKKQLGRKLSETEKKQIRSRLKNENAEKKENSIRWIGLLSLFFIFAGIMVQSFAPPVSKLEEIPRELFPRYGSTEQKDEDDYVQLSIESIEYVGKGSRTSTTKMRVGTMSNSTYYQLYLVKDDGGRLLAYADKDSHDMSLTMGEGYLEKYSLPFTVYGSLTTIEKFFSSFDGYDQSLKKYSDYDLVIEFEGSKIHKTIELEENNRVRNLINNVQYGLIIAGVVSFVIYRYKKKEIVKKNSENS